MNYEEIWKPSNGNDGYSVSNMGRVRNDATGKILNGWVVQCTKKYKRHIVSLKTNDGKHKQYKVARLVATEFVPNPNKLPVVNHLDENPLNNRADNLQWTTFRKNFEYSLKRHPSHKIDVSLFETIRQEYKSGKSMMQISREMGLPYRPLKKIITDAGIEIKNNGCKKYDIDLDQLLSDFKNGMTYKELMTKYKCSRDILVARKCGFRKRGLLE